MKNIFYFKDVQVHSCKVSAAGMVGLPPLTALTGLGAAFAALVAEELGQSPSDISCSGVLLALDTYSQHEGHKKGFKVNDKSVTYEAMVSVWASAQVHLAFELQANTPAAADALTNGRRPLVAARECLLSLNLAKGELRFPGLPRLVQGDANNTARQNLMARLPGYSEVVVDASVVIEAMREQGIPLMQGLTCAAMSPLARPEPFRSFFAETFGKPYEVAQKNGQPPLIRHFEYSYLPIQNGFTLLDAPPAESSRVDFYGQAQESQYASPTLSLVTLMPVKDLRGNGGNEPFWTMRRTQRTFFCTTN